MLGVVTNIFHDKGFGFIIDEEWNNRYFHATNLCCEMKDIAKKGVVSFNADKNEQGNIAINVMPINHMFEDIRPNNYDEIINLLDKYFTNAKQRDNNQISQEPHIYNTKKKKLFAVQENTEVSIYKLFIDDVFSLDFINLVDENISIKEMSKIIDALFFHLPLPPIIIYQDKYLHYEILYGTHIITSIYYFIHNRYRLESCVLRQNINGHFYDAEEAPLYINLKDYFTNIKLQIIKIKGEKAGKMIGEIREFYKTNF